MDGATWMALHGWRYMDGATWKALHIRTPLTCATKPSLIKHTKRFGVTGDDLRRAKLIRCIHKKPT
jgi:hypothetical protein